MSFSGDMKVKLEKTLQDEGFKLREFYSPKPGSDSKSWSCCWVMDRNMTWNGRAYDMTVEGVAVTVEPDDDDASVLRLYITSVSGWLVYFVIEEMAFGTFGTINGTVALDTVVSAVTGGIFHRSSTEEALQALKAVADPSYAPTLAGYGWSATLMEALL